MPKDYPHPRHGPGDSATNPETSDTQRPAPARVIGIGASAGGLTALKKLFAAIPQQPGACFVVVVHLSPEHESHLADLLRTGSRLPVQQVAHVTPLETDHIYVIPPGRNIDAIDTHLHLSDLETQREKRAPIDHFFRTLAEAHQDRAVGVVLTGTGSDGTLGLRRIRERGGLTIVQSPDEAEYDAMPRSAITAGVADMVLGVEQIAAQLAQVNQTPQLTDAEDAPAPAEQIDRPLQHILAQVRSQTGHDFSHYKRATILRRIRRRIQLHRLSSLEAYLQLLHQRDGEIALLFEDLLITVTEFFRDPEVFQHLAEHIVPRLFQGKDASQSVRAWSVGCATGEEAYSLAMLLMEEDARREVRLKQIQIFATDLHEPALRTAREGLYPESIEVDLAPARLREFFQKENGSYRVRKQVRERIVFALHDVLQDPPFSHLQLIACRNLFIYLQRDIQQQLTALFHYALEEDGYLLVGTAEAIESDLFICENKQLGLYRRRSVPTQKPQISIFPLSSSQRPAPDQPADDEADHTPLSYGAMHEQVVEQYAPPSILMNAEGEIVHYSARAGRFLQLPGGTPTNNAFQLLPEPLRFELRTALHAARDREAGYRSKPIPLSRQNESTRLVLRVQAIEQPRLAGHFLVIFDELERPDQPPADDQHATENAQARELEAELDQTRKQMQALTEEHEASQERLQAYNEELESTNEELRSTMEELETSKEEMQSMNEELTTLNEENRQKIEELDQLSGDLRNLLNATQIATVFLDREMRILRFTPAMAELFNMRDSDRGRSLADLTSRLGYDQLQEDFKRVLAERTPVQREVASEHDRWYQARLQPYRTAEDRIQGVVFTFIDITERREAEEKIRQAKKIADEVIDTVRNPILVLNSDLRVHSTNDAFSSMFNLETKAAQGCLVYELNDGQWNIPHLRTLLESILPEDKEIKDFDVEHKFAQLGMRSLLLNARRIDHLQLILLAIEDITERKQARLAMERSHEDLERQVRDRTAQLNQQTRRLQNLVRELSSAEQREQKRMASMLHDDLQQLLVGVKMQLDLASQQIQSQPASEAINQATQTLDESIETTRNLVRQVSPHLRYERGLMPALHWLREEMSRRHGLEVHIDAEADEPETDEQSRALLFESIREMLFNVVKHANVREAAVQVRQRDDRLSVAVSDQGCGFDVNQKRVESDDSGFGLFSVGERIEAWGGSWSIDSSPGQGTRVEIQIPFAHGQESMATIPTGNLADADAAPTQALPHDSETAPVRILVVDDHRLVRDGIIQILAQDARIVVIGEAGEGREALARVQEHHPDLVLMDVNMPGMDGIEATRELRRAFPDTLVVGLSVQDDDSESARQMTEAGAAAFLPKTGDSRKMVETILRVVRGDHRP